MQIAKVVCIQLPALQMHIHSENYCLASSEGQHLLFLENHELMYCASLYNRYLIGTKVDPNAYVLLAILCTFTAWLSSLS